MRIPLIFYQSSLITNCRSGLRKTVTSPNLYVVFYRSPDGNYQHWGLYLDDIEPLRLEVIGQHLIFEPNIVKKRPERSTVGDFCRRYTSDIETVKQVIKRVPVDNEMVR